MSKSKILIFWAILFILSIISFVLCFPLLLLSFYPYSIVVLSLYAIIVAILSVLSFHKKTQSIKIKRILWWILLVPMVALIVILISIQTQWLHFPG